MDERKWINWAKLPESAILHCRRQLYCDCLLFCNPSKWSYFFTCVRPNRIRYSLWWSRQADLGPSHRSLPKNHFCFSQNWLFIHWLEQHTNPKLFSQLESINHWNLTFRGLDSYGKFPAYCSQSGNRTWPEPRHGEWCRYQFRFQPANYLNCST